MFFWLLRPIEAMIEALHSKRYTYILLGIGVIATEAVYSLRVGTVTYGIFASVMPGDFLVPIGGGALTTLATFITGYIVATHESKDWKDFAGIVVVVLCDWGATIYTVFPNGFPVWSSEGPRYVVCAALCLIGLLPFLLGYWMIAVQPAAIAEKKKYGDEKDEGKKTRRLRNLENLAEKVAENAIRKDTGLLLENFLTHSGYAAVKSAVIEAVTFVNEEMPEEYEQIAAPATVARIAAPRQQQIVQGSDLEEEEEDFSPRGNSGKLNGKPHTDPLINRRIPTINEIRSAEEEEEDDVSPLVQRGARRAGQ